MRRFLNLSSRSPESPHLLTDPRFPWFSLLCRPLPLRNYLEIVDRHYSHESGLILGPDDWFVSRLEAYKYESSVQHELLCVTAKRTPRLPMDPYHKDGKINSLVEACIIIDRCLENKESTKDSVSKDDMETLEEGLGIADETHARRSSSSSSDKFSPGIGAIAVLVTWKYDTMKARDTAQLIRQKEMVLKGCVKLGHMDFPTHNLLPAENDFRGALEALENPLVEPLTVSPRSVSLPTLISLASFISQKYPLYSPTGKNCYWFCATIIHILRKYARVGFTLTAKANIDIGYEEDRASINEKIKMAKTSMGRYSFLTITGTPEDRIIAQDVTEWKSEDEKRVQELRAARRAKLTKMKEVQDRADRADRERERADDEKKRADKEKKRADDLQRALDALTKLNIPIPQII